MRRNLSRTRTYSV